MECSSDVNCSAFRYSPTNGFGFKCKDSYPTNKGIKGYIIGSSRGYEKNDWLLCNFDSGKNMIFSKLVFIHNIILAESLKPRISFEFVFDSNMLSIDISNRVWTSQIKTVDDNGKILLLQDGKKWASNF